MKYCFNTFAQPFFFINFFTLQKYIIFVKYCMLNMFLERGKSIFSRRLYISLLQLYVNAKT